MEKYYGTKIWTAIVGLVIGAALALTTLPFLADAAGHIGWRNVNTEMRTRSQTWRMAGTVAADTTSGTNGVVGATTVNGVAAPSMTGSFVFAPPYPAKLDVALIDSPNDDTLTCTSVTIAGRNQYGIAISETVSTITETAVETVKAYEIVTSITGAGCAGATDATDVLRVAVSNEIALDFPIATEGAIIQMCFYDLTNTDLLCGRAEDFVTDLVYDTVELDGAVNVLEAPATGDVFIVRYRPPSGK